MLDAETQNWLAARELEFLPWCTWCGWNYPTVGCPYIGYCIVRWRDTDWKDVAEFESRVALLLTKSGNWKPCYHKRCPYGKPARAACRACKLKHARLAVEREMDE